MCVIRNPHSHHQRGTTEWGALTTVWPGLGKHQKTAAPCSLGPAGVRVQTGPSAPGLQPCQRHTARVPPEAREGLREALSMPWDSTYPSCCCLRYRTQVCSQCPRKGYFLRGEGIYRRSPPEPLNPNSYLLGFLKIFPSLEIIKVCEIPTVLGNL